MATCSSSSLTKEEKNESWDKWARKLASRARAKGKERIAKMLCEARAERERLIKCKEKQLRSIANAIRRIQEIHMLPATSGTFAGKLADAPKLAPCQVTMSADEERSMGDALTRAAIEGFLTKASEQGWDFMRLKETPPELSADLMKTINERIDEAVRRLSLLRQEDPQKEKMSTIAQIVLRLPGQGGQVRLGDLVIDPNLKVGDIRKNLSQQLDAVYGSEYSSVLRDAVQFTANGVPLPDDKSLNELGIFASSSLYDLKIQVTLPSLQPGTLSLAAEGWLHWKAAISLLVFAALVPLGLALRRLKPAKHGYKVPPSSTLSRQTLTNLGGRIPYDVFFMNTRPEKSLAVATMKEALEVQGGLRCLLDQELRACDGSPTDKMRFALESCRHAVAVVSRRFLDRRHPCDELVYAYQRMLWIRKHYHGWQSLWIVLYDMTVEEFKTACRLRQLDLPGVCREISLMEFHSNGKGNFATWPQLYHNLLDQMMQSDLNGAVAQWKTFLDAEWGKSSSSPLWWSPTSSSRTDEADPFPRADSLYTRDEEEEDHEEHRRGPGIPGVPHAAPLLPVAAAC